MKTHIVHLSVLFYISRKLIKRAEAAREIRAKLLKGPMVAQKESSLITRSMSVFQITSLAWISSNLIKACKKSTGIKSPTQEVKRWIDISKTLLLSKTLFVHSSMYLIPKICSLMEIVKSSLALMIIHLSCILRLKTRSNHQQTWEKIQASKLNLSSRLQNVNLERWTTWVLFHLCNRTHSKEKAWTVSQSVNYTTPLQFSSIQMLTTASTIQNHQPTSPILRFQLRKALQWWWLARIGSHSTVMMKKEGL